MTNGDKYKTAQERENAFYDFCESINGNCGRCSCYGKGEGGRLSCVLIWLDLEAEEKKPLPCPFCGSEAVYVHGGFGERYHVHCGYCGYASRLFEENYYAIAAHNRVAKAVRESEWK